MKLKARFALMILFAWSLVLPALGADPLPSWNEGEAKQSVIEFVQKVTTPGSPDFVPVPERIAVYDNDGTLWAERPIPVQAAYMLDRIKALAPQHPEWKTQEPFAALLKGDVSGALAGRSWSRSAPTGCS